MSGPADRATSPETRWEAQVVGDRWSFYTDRFDRLHAQGADLEGEARFVDAMMERDSAVLDAGCGTGRIAAALHRMGHRCVGVDKDAGLVEIARTRYPGVPYVACDLLLLTPDLLAEAGGPDQFDVIALPGNVMVYLAPGSERQVLGVLADLLRPGGRIVAGFATGREFTPDAFVADAAAVGLTLEHRFATWQLDPDVEGAEWAVLVLRLPDDSPPADRPEVDRTAVTPATSWPSGPPA